MVEILSAGRVIVDRRRIAAEISPLDARHDLPQECPALGRQAGAAQDLAAGKGIGKLFAKMSADLAEADQQQHVNGFHESALASELIGRDQCLGRSGRKRRWLLGVWRLPATAA